MRDFKMNKKAEESATLAPEWVIKIGLLVILFIILGIAVFFLLKWVSS